MKEFTCASLGGTCEAVISGNSPEEVMGNGWQHLEETHPDMATAMKAMPQEGKEEWTKNFRAQWDSAPEA